MERYSVASSNIASIGYDAPSQILEVEFLSGTIYQYFGVPENMYNELMQAGSKGRFLNTYIRNAYGYSRVG
jgi:hypothetical protein